MGSEIGRADADLASALLEEDVGQAQLARQASSSAIGHQLRLSERKLLLGIGDLLCISVALAGALAVGWRGLGSPSPSLTWFIVLACVWFLVGPAFGAYDLKTASDLRTGTFSVWQGASVTLAVYFLIPYLSAPLLDSRAMMLTFAATSFGALGLWRAMYGTVVSQPRFRVRALVLGAGRAGISVVDAVRTYAPQDYEPIAYVDDDPEKCGRVINGLPVLPPPDDLAQMVEQCGVQELIVAIPHEMRPKLQASLIEAFESGVRVVSMDEVYESVTSRIAVEHVGQHWIVALPTSGDGGVMHELIRRGSDIVAGLLGAVITAIIFTPIAIAIKLDSPGPVLYTQDRVGRRGKTFRLMKFRSMTSDAEKDGVPVWAIEKDPRATRMGRFLRSTRLDELPQFVSILRGDMSLIGPRPERPVFVEQLQLEIPFYRARLLVRPGLTGWAQVMYRYGNTREDALTKLQYDLYYVKHRSLYLDFVILLRTIGVVLRRAGT